MPKYFNSNSKISISKSKFPNLLKKKRFEVQIKKNHIKISFPKLYLKDFKLCFLCASAGNASINSVKENVNPVNLKFCNFDGIC